ncbi:phasin family protein [Ferrovibrio sp.]|uniref:phasin family protein n=1 Tax=Ferrovibrio sp. TaxID=1917215 RepID=UPI00263182E7|nr:TIGR01841 family phasin [Ferrovibrio sp.]
MSKTAENPFAAFDPTKMFADLKLPGIDPMALAATQQKNLEAISAANKRALEGYQAVAKRQAEIFQQAAAEAATLMKGGVSTGMPDPTVAKQAVEKAVANLRELAEMMSKTNSEAFELINQRMNENLEEFRKAFSAPKK